MHYNFVPQIITITQLYVAIILDIGSFSNQLNYILTIERYDIGYSLVCCLYVLLCVFLLLFELKGT